jgi:hypothetical protein
MLFAIFYSESIMPVCPRDELLSLHPQELSSRSDQSRTRGLSPDYKEDAEPRDLGGIIVKLEQILLRNYDDTSADSVKTLPSFFMHLV